MLVSLPTLGFDLKGQSSLWNATSAMSGYGGTPCEIIVKLSKIDGRKSATMKDRNGQSYKAPVYMVSSQLGKVNDFCRLGWGRCAGTDRNQSKQGQET